MPSGGVAIGRFLDDCLRADSVDSFSALVITTAVVQIEINGQAEMRIMRFSPITLGEALTLFSRF